MARNKRNDTPSYMECYIKIKDQILSHAYKYGDRLPSKRSLALSLNVSVITTEHAYELLLEEGYIEARERSGYFVIYRDEDFFTEKKSEILTSASANTINEKEEQLHFPFSQYAKTYRHVLTEMDEKLFIKSPNQGLLELRSAIAGYLVRYRGMSVSPEQILIGSGAEYLYGMVVQMLGTDRIYALENPSYETIRNVYEANGARTELLDMGSDGIKSSELYNSRASILHVTPFHSYPTGVTASASKRREYVQWAKERNGYIIEDDYDSEFTVSRKREDTLFSIEPDDSVIYINTFSRTISRATRAGYLILPKNRAAELMSRISFYSCSVPVIDQYVLTEIINNGAFTRHINKVRRMFRSENEKN